MSTAQLIGADSEEFRERAGGGYRDPNAGAGRRSSVVAWLPVLLASGLLVIVLYAAFAHGAVSLSTEARIQVALAALAALAGAGWLWLRRMDFSASGLATAGVWLLAAFAAWSGITVLWSVAPDQTWIELNRAVSYVIVLCLGIAIGASHRGSIELVAKGFLAIALAVTAYGLGQKLFPGIHLDGVFNLDQTGPLPRLQEPLGYWNALALFVVLGVPTALALAVDLRRSPAGRLAALCAVEVMLLVIGLTFSRGGLLALAAAIAVGVAMSGARLRSLMWLALAVAATVPALVLGLAGHSLTAADVPLASRESAGGVLAVVVLVSLIALVLAGSKLLAVESRVRLGGEEARTIGRLLAALAAVLLVAAVVAVSFSSRGLGGSISHAWKSFTTTKATSNYDPHRLLSADSENRWVWWKEAVGAFSDRPLQGWGAGSFPVVHLLYRRDTLTVQQPHSVPLQFLAETGIVGVLLSTAAMVLLLAAAGRSVRGRAGDPKRRRSGSSKRLLAAALFGAAVAYAVHSLYDWDWDIPAVTLPAMIFVGVLIGCRPVVSAPDGRTVRPKRKWRGFERVLTGPPRAPVSGLLTGMGRGGRGLYLALLTLFLCMFVLSAALPSLAASKSSSALVASSSSSPASLGHARRDAALATRLDPLSDMGLRAEATIALHQGLLGPALQDLLAAIRRDPTDVQAWEQLAGVELDRGDSADAVRISRRLLELDPRGASGASVFIVASAITPPADSATAVRTPIPGG